MSNKNIVILSLALMLFVPIALIGSAVYDRATGDVWQVKIRGADPMDILRGHYLNYRYDWSMAGGGNECTASGFGQHCCLCFNESKPGSRIDPLVKSYNCDSPALGMCQSVIVDRPSHRSGVLSSPQAYFIPENHATMLDQKLREGKETFRVELVIPHSGKAGAAVRKLFIGDQSAEEYMATNR